MLRPVRLLLPALTQGTAPIVQEAGTQLGLSLPPGRLTVMQESETQTRSLSQRGSSLFAGPAETPKRQGVVGAGAAAGVLLLLDDDAADEDESPPDELLLEEDSAELPLLLDDSDDEASALVEPLAGSASLLVELVLFL